MKAKQINKLLKGTIDKFCESIGNTEIEEIIKTKSFISGGCIPSMLLDEYVNDFDFYFIDKESADKVREYFSNVDTDEDSKFHVKLITNNAINLSDKIQLITRFYGIPDKVVDNFDWQHIKSYYTYPDKLSLDSEVYRLIVEKELVYTGSKYPLSSLLRVKKYAKKGWDISNKTMVHIALDIVQSFMDAESKRKSRSASRYRVEDYEEYGDIDVADDLTIDDNDSLTEHPFSVEDLIRHLNGVDPLTVQVQLQNKLGEYLTISQIVRLMD